jgi:hypothetical protein
MSALVWVLGAGFFIAGAWFLLKVAIGFLAPAEWSGKAYLRQALGKRGVGPDLISDVCIYEVVKRAEQTATSLVAIGRPFSETFVSHLEIAADGIADWVANPDDPTFRQTPWDDLRVILERHAQPPNLKSQRPQRAPSGYYDWIHGSLSCVSCDWNGLGEDAVNGESFDDGVEKHCPRCGHRFGFVAYPFHEEVLADPRASESDKVTARWAIKKSRD